MSGGYVLGFRIDPEEKLHVLYKELISLNEVYSNNPIYGVEYNWSTAKQEGAPSSSLVDFDEEAEEPRGEMSSTLISYLAEGNRVDRPPMYSTELGLAVEAIKDGYTLQKLWEVIPQ